MLPKNLILVRHGESEFNQLISNLRRGICTYEDLGNTILNQPGSKWRLTQKGCQQAEIAGQYLRDNIQLEFDGFFVSDYIRTKETAAALNLPNAQWKVEPYLRERDWGTVTLQDFINRTGGVAFKENDPFYGTPTNGESISTVCLRVDRVLDTLHREYADKNVIIVCHGELMWAFRIRLERIFEDDFIKLDKSTNPHDRIHNTQILHYGLNGTQMRSICPTDETLSSNNWQLIKRKQFTNEDLHNQVNQYRHLLCP